MTKQIIITTLFALLTVIITAATIVGIVFIIKDHNSLLTMQSKQVADEATQGQVVNYLNSVISGQKQPVK